MLLLININKSIVPDICDILLSASSGSLGRRVLRVHRGVVDLGRKTSRDTLPLALLVVEEEQDDLDADAADESGKDGHDGSDALGVVRPVAADKEKRTDNVAGSAGSVEQGHGDGFLGLAS